MDTYRVKRKLKFGPKVSREACAEFALTLANLSPRNLKPETLAKVRAEVERLSGSPDSRVQEFVAAMRKRYPELRRRA